MSEKTEPATEKKLQKAREKGQVAQSRDLSASFAFAFAVAALLITASHNDQRIRSIFAGAMRAAAHGVDGTPATLAAAGAMAVDGIWIVAPVLAAAAVGGVVGGLTHVGFNVSFEPLLPKPEKINPAAGMKRMFSTKTLFDVFKSVVQAGFIGWMLFAAVTGLLPTLVVSGYGLPTGIGQTAWSSVVRMLLLSALLFAVLGVLDFAVQRMIFLKDQKMSKDEVKREWKEDEGDPQLKGERKELAREIAFSDPPAAVATASAVVVNPTHYAVALRYAPDECGLPTVVAKGVDDDAKVIREAAVANGVPIIGNPPLARALFRVSVDATVPEPLLEAVAIVLRWAQQMRE